MENKNTPWHCIIKNLKNEVLSEREQHELQLWLNGKDNRKFYENIEYVWNVIQEKSQHEPDVERCEKELLNRLHRKGNKKAFKINIYKSAAAILIIVLTVGFYFKHASQEERKNTTNQEHVEAEPVMISDENGKTKCVLPDNSVVWLNTNSTLAYDNSFGRDNREVRITGEAYFEVAKGNVPFWVNMDDVTVKVHGTKFNVNATDQAKTRVSLNEGSVEIITQAGSNYIVPGQLAVYDKSQHSVLTTESDVDMECCWAKDQIVFEQASLDKVCKYLSKRYHTTFNVPQPITEKYLYTFILKDESIEDILMLMATIHPLTFSYEESEQLYLVRQRKILPME